MGHPHRARATGRRSGVLGTTAVTLAALVAVPAVVPAAPPRASDRPDDLRPVIHPTRLAKMTLLGRTPAGTQPDGVATDPVISHDSRANRYVAYASTATNIAAPVEPGRRNVYLVTRTGKVTMNANRWEVGPTRLLSVGTGGAPANGDSWGPALSGYTARRDRPGRPRLYGFLTVATNLVAGSPVGVPHAVIGNVVGGPLVRVPTPGAATGISISGDSSTVAVATTRGLYVRRGGRLRRVVGGTVRSPSVTYNGRQIAYEKRGRVYVVTVPSGRRRLIASGTAPSADDGAPTGGRRRGYVRAIAYRQRGGGVRRAEIAGSRVIVRRYGAGVATSLNAGGSAVAFGRGPNVRLRVYVLGGGKHGGYKLPQGTCLDGTPVTGTSVSARYNYIAFTCGGGALILQYVGPK